MIIQNIFNLVGKDSLLGNLIAVARQLHLEFTLTNSEHGKQYIASLSEHFEFGLGLHPEVGFCYDNECEAEHYTAHNHGQFASTLLSISQTEQPLCLFNHLGDKAWTYVFVLLQPADMITLFQHAQPCDYFLSNTKGQFILASNWHQFSFVSQ